MLAPTAGSKSLDAKEDHHVRIACAAESTVPLNGGWEHSRLITDVTLQGCPNYLLSNLQNTTLIRKNTLLAYISTHFILGGLLFIEGLSMIMKHHY